MKTRDLPSERRAMIFFKFFPFDIIALCDHWSGFPQSETKLPEYPLALSCAKIDTIFLPDVMAEKLPVPEVLWVTKIPGILPQISPYVIHYA